MLLVPLPTPGTLRLGRGWEWWCCFLPILGALLPCVGLALSLKLGGMDMMGDCVPCPHPLCPPQAQPTDMRALQDFEEPDKLHIQMNDIITVIEGRYCTGRGARTSCQPAWGRGTPRTEGPRALAELWGAGMGIMRALPPQHTWTHSPTGGQSCPCSQGGCSSWVGGHGRTCGQHSPARPVRPR